jgi:hypothetical protein
MELCGSTLRRVIMKKRSVVFSAMFGTLLLTIPMQSQAFFCGWGGGFSFGFGGGGWGYPYYGGYYPGYWGYGGYPYYAYRPYAFYNYPVAIRLPSTEAPEVAEK